jgi:hypothetical protein
MTTEKICVSRDHEAIESHKRRLNQVLTKLQKLVDMYLGLGLLEHSRSLPDIVKNTYVKCREAVQAGLSPALRNTNAAENILLNGEAEFFGFLTEMRKSGELDHILSFTLTRSGTVEINPAAVKQYEDEHSIFLQDMKAKLLLEQVVASINAWEEYSAKNYLEGATLILPAMNGGYQLNDRWHLCNRDENGSLVLNLSLLGLFERGRIK